MRKLLLALCFALLCGGFFANPARADFGCAPGWYPIDGQSWWWQSSFGGDKEFNSRHLHVGGCVPRRDQTLSGTVGFDVVVKMHNNPGKVYYVAVALFSGDGNEKSFSVNPAWTCPTSDCTFTKHFDIAMSSFTRSGLQEIRFRASDKQSDLGTEIRASVNFQTHVANGKSLGNVTRMPYLRGKGWYTGFNYCEASYRDDLMQWPAAPFVGTVSLPIRQIDHGTADANPTRHDARVDPNIHGGERGTFLMDGPGSYDGPLSLDSTLFPNGAHKLMLHTECETAAGVNAGVLLLPFDVAN